MSKPTHLLELSDHDEHFKVGEVERPKDKRRHYRQFHKGEPTNIVWREKDGGWDCCANYDRSDDEKRIWLPHGKGKLKKLKKK